MMSGRSCAELPEQSKGGEGDILPAFNHWII